VQAGVLQATLIAQQTADTQRVQATAVVLQQTQIAMTTTMAAATARSMAATATAAVAIGRDQITATEQAIALEGQRQREAASSAFFFGIFGIGGVLLLFAVARYFVLVNRRISVAVRALRVTPPEVNETPEDEEPYAAAAITIDGQSGTVVEEGPAAPPPRRVAAHSRTRSS